MTVALVFNAKAEAPTQSGISDGQGPELSGNESPSLPLSHHTEHSSIQPGTHRVNDMFAEWDTMDTINAVKAAVEQRYDVVLIEADEMAYQHLRDTRPDFVFNMSEGLYGASREAQIPAMLELLRIPYLGSDPLTLALCLDKSRAKEILAYHKIPTANFCVIRSMTDLVHTHVRFPAMVKPLHEGSSKGIFNSCVVKNGDELAEQVLRVLDTYKEPALIEDFLPGREFTVAILGNGAEARVLPIVEIKFDALPSGVNPIYSYEAKWIWDQSENPLEIFECPADVDDLLKHDIVMTCSDAYRVLNCRDWSRVDVRLDENGRPHIIEINPLPGILPRPEDNSCFPKAARAAGMSYDQLINTVLDIAMARCGVKPAQPRMAEVI